jgi:hypothetical protein
MWLTELKAIGANLALVTAVFGFGSWIPRLLPESFSRFTRLVCVMIGGFGLLGLTIFLVGHVALNRWTLGAILAIGAAVALFGQQKSLIMQGSSVPVARLPAAIVLTMLTLTAVAGLAEPVGDWSIDGVAYHLVGPKVWTGNGIIRPIADNMNTSYPCLGEMAFTALWAFGGDRAPGFSAVWTLALLLALAAALARRCGMSASGAWWVAAVVVTMPALYAGSHSAFVDVIYASFILAAIRVGLDATETKHFIAFGFFLGLAMAQKYTGLLALPLLIFCVLWRRSDQTREMRNALTTMAVACVVAAPMYLKNWIFLGTPLYPPPASVAKLLHVKYFPTEAIGEFYKYNIARGKGHGRGLLHFFTLPFNLTYHTADFSGGGGIGLTPLAFGPLGVLLKWHESFLRRLAMIAVLLLALWFATMQESRYLIHFYTLSAIFAAFGWQQAMELTGRRGRLLCTTVVALSLAYGAYMIGTVQVPAAYSVLSPKQGLLWHRNGVAFVQSMDYVNQNPEVTRVLLLDPSVLAYYSDKSYVKPFGQWGERPFSDVNTTAEALAHLKEWRISHVVDVESTVAGYQVPPNYPDLELVFAVSGQRVFKVVGASNR